jgi:hypothetical protein
MNDDWCDGASLAYSSVRLTTHTQLHIARILPAVDGVAEVNRRQIHTRGHGKVESSSIRDVGGLRRDGGGDEALQRAQRKPKLIQLNHELPKWLALSLR